MPDLDRSPAGAGNPDDAPDFSHYTCTSLMIRLKMLLKDAGPGTPVACIVRRDQCDTIEVPFSKSGYEVSVRKIGENRFLVTLRKKTGAGPR